jgi:hypothetical protein
MLDYPDQNRSGIAFMIRKARRFHRRIERFVYNKSMNSSIYRDFTRLEEFATHKSNKTESLKRLRTYKYFISYDPYSFWSRLPAMSGAVSIVVPIRNRSREEWVKSFYIGSYLEAMKLPFRIPGIAYGWKDEEELQYARKTMHELRPLLLNVNSWGEEVTLRRFVRDCHRWLESGPLSKFEGGVLAKDFFSSKYW